MTPTDPAVERGHLANIGLLVGAGLVAKGLFLAAHVVLYKSMDLTANGDFAMALTIATTAALIAELGTRGFATRELARLRHAVADDGTNNGDGGAQHLFGALLAGRVWLAVAGAAAVWLTARCYARPGGSLVPAAGWLALFALCDSFALFQKAVLRAYGRMEFDAVGSLVGRGLTLALLLTLGTGGALDAVTGAQAFALGALVEMILLAGAMAAATPLSLRASFDSAPMAAALRRSLPFGVVVAAGVLYPRVGAFVLGAADGLRRVAGAVGLPPWLLAPAPGLPPPLEGVALVALAARLPEALGFVPQAVMNAMTPHLARHAGELPLVSRHARRLTLTLGLTGMAAGGLMAAEPAWLLTVLAKPDFARAAPALRLFAASVPASFLLYAIANVLLCLGRERIVMRRYGLALALGVAINVPLAPRFGATGSAAAFVFSETLALALDLSALRAAGVVLGAFTGLRLAAAAAAGLAVNRLAALGLPDGGMAGSPMARLAVQAAAFTVIAIVALPADDRRLLFRRIRRVR